MTQQPDLNLLPIFTAVVEATSMSAAARRLRVPKSTVSRAILALEHSLGAQLFHRTTRSVTLTSAGRILYERALPLVASLREFTATLPEGDGIAAGQLTITTPRDVAVTWLSAALADFSRRHPQIRWHVIPTEHPMDLVQEGIDVGLRIARKLADPALVARKLSAIEFGLYAAPSYVTRRGAPRSVDDLPEHDWVELRTPKFRVSSMVGQVGEIRASSDDMMFVWTAVKQGLGIGTLPTFLADRSVLSHELTRIIPSWSLEPGSLYLVHPYRDRVPRKVAAFRDFMMSYLAVHRLRSSQ